MKSTLTVSQLKVQSGLIESMSITCRLAMSQRKVLQSTPSTAMLQPSNHLLGNKLVTRVRRQSQNIQLQQEKSLTLICSTSLRTRRKRRLSSVRIGRKELANLETSAPSHTELKTCTRRRMSLPATKLLSVRPTTRRLTSANTVPVANSHTSCVTSVPLLKGR